MKLKYIISSVLIFTIFLIGGCSLDINTDPNNPTTVPVSQLMSTVQVDLAGALGSSVGGLSGYTSAMAHQMFQRGNTHQDYDLKGTDFEVITPWNILYSRLLTDIRQIEALATAEEGAENWHYVGMAQIIKAYAFSIIVDVWGDVPFTEANLGAEVRAPKFDQGSAIYPQLFSMIDEGMANLDKSSSLSPGADDIIYNGDLAKWKKFARTLKLKMYNQIRLVQDVSSEVSALLQDESLLIGPGDDFEFPYGNVVSPLTRNPGYQQEYTPGGSFYYINPFFHEILSGKNTFFPVEGNIYEGLPDPRQPYYYYNQLAPGQSAENPTAYKDGEFVSIYMFSFNIDPNEGFDQASSQAVAGLYPLGGRFDDGAGGITSFNGVGDVPQRMLTNFARLYIQAELALEGVTTQDARALFIEAMDASFAKVNEVADNAKAPPLTDAAIDAYKAGVLLLYDAADDDTKLRHIMTQKWIASYGFGVDSYTDIRRTGYPLIHDGNTDNLTVTSRTRDYPLSYPWKSDDLDVNANAPSQKNIRTYGVFWDN